MKKLFLFFIIVLILIQFIRIDKKNPSTNLDLMIKAPKNIQMMLENSCYDCHSNVSKYPWYSNIAPFSWVIKEHIDDGRKALNFSIWERYSKKDKKKKLKKIFRVVYASMPPKSYLFLHKEAQLSIKQRKEIRDWTGVRK